MKRFALNLGIAAVLVASCSTKEIDFQTPVQDSVVFYAAFELPSEDSTRVYANKDLLLRWTANDRVSIFNKKTDNQQYKFAGETGDNVGGFDKVTGSELTTGNAIPHIVSVYPYQGSTKITESETITVILPAEQHYADNTFGLGANTMVSVTEDNFLQYKNVGGYLMLKLYGEGVSVSSITLKGNNGEKLAGKATVTMPLDDVPTAVMADEATTEITLVCDEPVALGPTAEESIDFWFVVPPITFNQGFSVIVKDRRGRVFEKTTARTIEIQRNHLSKMSAFEVIPTGDGDVITLSEVESANCYIVEKEGEYCFDATIMGNGDKGILDQEYFHSSTSHISPHKVSLLWQDHQFISDLRLQDGRVYFWADDVKGNALIAVMDENDVILWSWHIWATDRPAEIRLSEATHAFLDRNIGATTAQIGLESTNGLYYQWGRKDPFSIDNYTVVETPPSLSVERLIQNPTVLYYSEDHHWVDNPKALWGNPDGSASSSTFKTIYDPCPVGYTIPADDTWYEYDQEFHNRFEYLDDKPKYYSLYDPLIEFTYSSEGTIASKGGKSICYPLQGCLVGAEHKTNTYMFKNWIRGDNADALAFIQNTVTDYNTNETHIDYVFSAYNSTYQVNATPIRCIKEERQASVFPPSVSTNEASSISVTDLVLNGTINDNGNSHITKCGFIWGVSQNALNNEVVASEAFSSGFSQVFNTKLVELSPHTVIFFRAFAENAAGRSYGSTVSIRLPSVTEYTISQLDGLSRLMTKQYLSTQGLNGEGTIRLWHCDLQGVSISTPQTGWAPLYNSNYLTNTSSVYALFPLVYYYGIINRVNNLLDNYIPLADEYDPNIGYYKASLLGYRAYAYTMLVQLYCKSWNKSNNGQSQGVPLRIKTNEDVTSFTSLSKVYQQIYSDLDTAIALMKSSSIIRKDVNEIDIRVLYAIFAKAALNKNDYSTALDYAKLARTDHPLMTNQEYNAGFSVSNQEWIWGAHPDNKYESGIQLYYYSYFSYIGSNSASSISKNYPKSISKVLFERIPKTDIRKSLWLNPSGYTYDSYTGKASTSLSSYAKSNYSDALYSTSQIYAYMQFKFRNLGQPGLGQMNFIRAAEMVLIEAEANYFQGNEAETRSLLLYLNQQSGRDPQYRCEKSGNELLDELKFYRRVELWGEGFDWFDLKRWDDPVVRLSFADGGNFQDVFAGTWSASDKNDFVWAMPDNYEQYIREGVE